MNPDLTPILTRWSTDEGRPYKGKLIDKAAYNKDPDNIGCMCAQGQVLHLLGGWGADQLMNSDQAEADKATAELLGVSRAHAVLLRVVNDSADGAPAIVLTHPERVLGDQAQTVLAFWRYLDRMTAEQWRAAVAAAGAAAGGDAAGAAAGGAAAWAAARAAARDASPAATRAASQAAARAAAGAWAAAWAAAGVANEIQGAVVMRAKGQSFYFLPMFGFADPEAVLDAERAK